MGLDVVAYSRIVHIEALDDVEEYEKKYDWSTHSFVSSCYLNDDWYFSEWAEGLKLGVYYTGDGEIHSFRAGSYLWYNRWREWLCVTFLGVTPKVVWNDPNVYKDEPFFRLINFSDCEGYIGPKFSEKLAIDFYIHQETVDALVCDEWYKQQFTDWGKAFRLAADNGYIDFH